MPCCKESTVEDFCHSCLPLSPTSVLPATICPSQFSPIFPSQLGSGCFSLASVWISTLHLLITYTLVASIPWGPPCPSGSFSKWLQPVMLKPKPLSNVTSHSWCLFLSAQHHLARAPGVYMLGPASSHTLTLEVSSQGVMLQPPTMIFSSEWRHVCHIMVTLSLFARPNFLVYFLLQSWKSPPPWSCLPSAYLLTLPMSTPFYVPNLLKTLEK